MFSVLLLGLLFGFVKHCVLKGAILIKFIIVISIMITIHLILQLCPSCDTEGCITEVVLLFVH